MPGEYVGGDAVWGFKLKGKKGERNSRVIFTI